MNKKTVLKSLASLEFMLANLAVLMLLVILCTLAQVEIGTFNAVDVYFHEFFIYRKIGAWSVPVFPGGATVGLCLFVNLAAVLATRDLWNRKKAGILLIHIGLMLFVVGEFTTGLFSEESQIPIEEGQSRNWSEAPRADELVVIDRSDAELDTVYAMRDGVLRDGRTLSHPYWPFVLTVRRYFKNARVGARPPMMQGLPPSVADQGIGARSVIRPLPPVSNDDARNMRAAFIDIMRGDQRLGTWLVSSTLDAPQEFSVDGKRWTLQMRPRRTYLPFTLTLKDFKHDKYAGTNIPKNFSSLIRLRNLRTGEDRDVLIYMNNPLRYAGFTFFQASFGKADTLSVLQVVRNPGWLLPYISFGLVTLGLMFQFGFHLLKMKPKGLGAVKEKTRRIPKEVWAAIAVSVLILLSALRSPPESSIDHAGFAHLPVLHNGRVKPLDSIARTSLLMMHGKQTLKDDGQRLLASQWLLELMTHPQKADARRVFTIHDPDLLGLLGLKQEKRKAYAFDELLPLVEKIEVQAARAGRKKPQERTRFERAVFSLQNRLMLYRRLQSSLGVPGTEDYEQEIDEFEIVVTEGIAAFRTHMEAGSDPQTVTDSIALARLGAFFTRYRRLAKIAYYKAVLPPPGASADAWTSVGESLLMSMRSGGISPSARFYAGMLGAASRSDNVGFDKALAGYRITLEDRFPSAVRKAKYEAWLNHVSPFYRGMMLYVLTVLLIAAGWLLASEPLRRAGAWALGFGLFAHTFGLLSRMLLEMRPPVTNLYSSAVFVGWCGVLGGLLLERVHRRGIAAFAAACLGFATLIIAHHLSMAGDTLEMMQAVLDSNFWLGTHVVTITIGYSATFLAGTLAHIYLFRRLTGSLDKETKQSLYQMTYGVICFALLFSFIGTILGGIWADQSWGRFWGWDPKENGAFLIVVWNAMILHARLAGRVRETGFMGMAVFGNIVTAFSWFGVNMLGIGLHSYGFMDKAFWWIIAFAAVELVVLCTAGLRPRQPGPASA